MSDLDSTTVAGGSGLIGSAATVLALWLKARFSGNGNGKHEENGLKDRLTRIEGQLEAVKADNLRNETGISALQAKLDTMHQAAATAQIELATTLGRIEGEMRARRERGQVTP